MLFPNPPKCNPAYYQVELSRIVNDEALPRLRRNFRTVYDTLRPHDIVFIDMKDVVSLARKPFAELTKLLEHVRSHTDRSFYIRFPESVKISDLPATRDGILDIVTQNFPIIHTAMSQLLPKTPSIAEGQA